MDLSKVLNVSELWLAGYPCQMERGNDSERILSDDEQSIIIAYRLHPEFQDAVKKLLGVKK